MDKRYQREVIRIRKSKKNKQHNGQKKKYKRTNNDLQNIHIKLNSVVDSKPKLNIYLLHQWYSQVNICYSFCVCALYIILAAIFVHQIPKMCLGSLMLCGLFSCNFCLLWQRLHSDYSLLLMANNHTTMFHKLGSIRVWENKW